MRVKWIGYTHAHLRTYEHTHRHDTQVWPYSIPHFEVSWLILFVYHPDPNKIRCSCSRFQKAKILNYCRIKKLTCELFTHFFSQLYLEIESLCVCVCVFTKFIISFYPLKPCHFNTSAQCVREPLRKRNTETRRHTHVRRQFFDHSMRYILQPFVVYIIHRHRI